MFTKALRLKTILLKRIVKPWLGVLNEKGFLSYLAWLFTATLIALFMESSFKVLKYATGGELANDVRGCYFLLEDVDWDGSEYKKNN